MNDKEKFILQCERHGLDRHDVESLKKIYEGNPFTVLAVAFVGALFDLPVNTWLKIEPLQYREIIQLNVYNMLNEAGIADKFMFDRGSVKYVG